MLAHISHSQRPQRYAFCIFTQVMRRKELEAKNGGFPGELRLVSAIHQHLEQLKRLVVKTTFGWISNPNRLEESDLSVSYSESTPESSSASPIEMIEENQESLDPSELLKHQLLQTETEIARLNEQTRLLKENFGKKIELQNEDLNSCRFCNSEQLMPCSASFRFVYSKFRSESTSKLSFPRLMYFLTLKKVVAIKIDVLFFISPNTIIQWWYAWLNNVRKV